MPRGQLFTINFLTPVIALHARYTTDLIEQHPNATPQATSPRLSRPLLPAPMLVAAPTRRRDQDAGGPRGCTHPLASPASLPPPLKLPAHLAVRMASSEGCRSAVRWALAAAVFAAVVAASVDFSVGATTLSTATAVGDHYGVLWATDGPLRSAVEAAAQAPAEGLTAASSPPVSHGGTEESTTLLSGLPRWALWALAVACLVLAATAAGLTLGLMSLDTVGLDIMAASTNPREAAAARAIQPVRQQGHRLLVTLLLTMTIVTELLPLVLETLYPGGVFALAVSVMALLLFGEIFPQAVCSRHALSVGAALIGVVRALMWVATPLALPLAAALDWLLGSDHAQTYDRHGLGALIDVHARPGVGEGPTGVLSGDEARALKGALELCTKTAGDIMTPASDVFALSMDDVLDRETMKECLRRGHSRVPVYGPGGLGDVVGLLLLKQLILLDPDDAVPVRVLVEDAAVVAGGQAPRHGRRLRVTPPLLVVRSTPLRELLHAFRDERVHLACVYEALEGVARADRVFVGVVCLEDVIEELLDDEIVDETDATMDNVSKQPATMARAASVAAAAAKAGEGARGTGGGDGAADTSVPGGRATPRPRLVLREIDVARLRSPLAEQVAGAIAAGRPDVRMRRVATAPRVGVLSGERGVHGVPSSGGGSVADEDEEEEAEQVWHLGTKPLRRAALNRRTRASGGGGSGGGGVTSRAPPGAVPGSSADSNVVAPTNGAAAAAAAVAPSGTHQHPYRRQLDSDLDEDAVGEERGWDELCHPTRQTRSSINVFRSWDSDAASSGAGGGGGRGGGGGGSGQIGVVGRSGRDVAAAGGGAGDDDPVGGVAGSPDSAESAPGRVDYAENSRDDDEVPTPVAGGGG